MIERRVWYDTARLENGVWVRMGRHPSEFIANREATFLLQDYQQPTSVIKVTEETWSLVLPNHCSKPKQKRHRKYAKKKTERSRHRHGRS